MPLWIDNTKSKFKDALFKRIHGNNLIYNVCWEDPAIDRKVLDINEDSKMLMITSAGCNALEYLLDNPKKIYTVDLNPRQNAVLELKRALIKHTDWHTLFEFFGKGALQNPDKIYKDVLRDELSKPTRQIWDKKLDYFKRKESGKTYLFRGTSGNLAWLVRKYLNRHKKLNGLIEDLFACTNLQEQAEVYEKIEVKLWNGLINWLLDQQLTMTMIGVPEAQKRLIDEQYPGGMGEYMKTSFRNVFANLPIQDNYFWYGYLFGHYTTECCPGYLKKENFETLRSRVDNISIQTISMADFLELNDEEISQFILLDHQDWMAAHLPLELEREWKAIMMRAKDGAKMLMRSAGITIDFIPGFVTNHVNFDDELAKAHHLEDRVGTYASMHIGTFSK